MRPARPGDAAEIARIQLLTWRTAYGDVIPAPALAVVDDEQATVQWRAAVEEAPGPAYRVLVAAEGAVTVGFAALEPDPEDPAVSLVTTLLVEPRWGRRGHGSRLLAALVDHARQDGRHRLQAWLLERDKASLGFYTSAGWARDGWVRTLEPEGATIREVRLHTSLVEGDS